MPSSKKRQKFKNKNLLNFIYKKKSCDLDLINSVVRIFLEDIFFFLILLHFFWTKTHIFKFSLGKISFVSWRYYDYSAQTAILKDHFQNGFKVVWYTSTLTCCPCNIVTDSLIFEINLHFSLKLYPKSFDTLQNIGSLPPFSGDD